MQKVMTRAAKRWQWRLNPSEPNRIGKLKISRNDLNWMKIKRQIPKYEKNECGIVKMDWKVSENGLDRFKRFLVSCLFELVELVFQFYLNYKHKSRKVLIIHAHQNCSHAYVCFLQASYICIPFICFYLALQILPVWFFLLACFSTHCLFCHFTLSRSGLSRFPPPVTWPSVPLSSLKHIALINSLCIYNPSSPCLSCHIVIGYLYTPNRIKMPQINTPIRISRPKRVGINPFVNWSQDKLITDCFLAVFLLRMPSVLM